ncbi:MAG: hypothetical protein ACHRXM_09960 [Isosphaerales bacterium]
MKKRWGEDALKRLGQKNPEFVAGEAEALFERALAQYADVSAFWLTTACILLNTARRCSVR